MILMAYEVMFNFNLQIDSIDVEKNIYHIDKRLAKHSIVTDFDYIKDCAKWYIENDKTTELYNLLNTVLKNLDEVNNRDKIGSPEIADILVMIVSLVKVYPDEYVNDIC